MTRCSVSAGDVVGMRIWSSTSSGERATRQLNLVPPASIPPKYWPAIHGVILACRDCLAGAGDHGLPEQTDGSQMLRTKRAAKELAYELGPLGL